MSAVWLNSVKMTDCTVSQGGIAEAGRFNISWLPKARKESQ